MPAIILLAYYLNYVLQFVPTVFLRDSDLNLKTKEKVSTVSIKQD